MRREGEIICKSAGRFCGVFSVGCGESWAGGLAGERTVVSDQWSVVRRPRTVDRGRKTRTRWGRAAAHGLGSRLLGTVCAGRGKLSAKRRARFAACFEGVGEKWVWAIAGRELLAGRCRRPWFPGPKIGTAWHPLLWRVCFPRIRAASHLRLLDRVGHVGRQTFDKDLHRNEVFDCRNQIF